MRTFRYSAAVGVRFSVPEETGIQAVHCLLHSGPALRIRLASQLVSGSLLANYRSVDLNGALFPLLSQVQANKL